MIRDDLRVCIVEMFFDFSDIFSKGHGQKEAYAGPCQFGRVMTIGVVFIQSFFSFCYLSFRANEKHVS